MAHVGTRGSRLARAQTAWVIERLRAAIPERRWLEALFSMRYDEPAHREMMDLEGLKEWLPGRTSGFGPLSEAVERQRFFSG